MIAGGCLEPCCFRVRIRLPKRNKRLRQVPPELCCFGVKCGLDIDYAAEKDTVSMGKKVWDGAVLLAPVPAAIVTCSAQREDGSAEVNALTVAWTGILSSHPPKTYISLRPSRYSYDIIKRSGEFAVNLTTEKLVRAADFCGVRSGRNMNKIEACGLHTENASKIGVPILSESPLSLECRVTDIIHLGSHVMFVADIVAVDVDDSLLDPSGRLSLEKAGLIAYAHGDYFALGRRLGDFGFSVRKKKGRSASGKRPPKKGKSENK